MPVMPPRSPVTDPRIHAGPRTRAVPGDFVLYWIQTTMRSRENPALNFAAERANELGLPLVVYQGLRPDYPWASDRFHTFILESAADLAAAFAAAGTAATLAGCQGFCCTGQAPEETRPLR